MTTLSSVTAGGRVSLVVGLRSCSQRYSLAWPYVTTVCRTRDPDLVPIGDFNGDGKDDLYLNAKEGNSQAILLGRSGSGFSISAVSPGAGSVSLTAIAANAGVAGFWGSVRAVGDVDGDRFDDFMLPTLPALGDDGAIVRGRANPPASLPAAGSLYLIDGAALGTAGDQTGDGRTDLLVARDAQIKVASLPAGATSFAAGTQTTIADLPDPNRSLRAGASTGDLDGDGQADALMAAGASVFRLTHTGQAPATRLEARTVVLGPTGFAFGGQDVTITAACAGGAAVTKTVPNSVGVAVFDGGGTLTAGDRCTVSSTTELPTQLPFDTCRWVTSVTYRGATVPDGAVVTLGTNPNEWVKTITCLPAQSTAYPTSFENWRTTGSASITFDANRAMALTSGLGQTGSAVWANPLNWNNKAIEFTLSMNSGNGAAEGVTMAFLNDAGGQPAGGWMGTGGGQLGFGGLGGIALAFDAFKQPEDAQPNTVNWVDGPQGASLRKLYSKDAGLRLRGTPVKVRVVVKDGRLTATLNGKFVHSVAATIPSPAYLAFTGSTSLQLWQTQSISGLT
ncbi:MAG: VCBS repeat-containing protein, partial [Solirubrobacteraceae bacterium]|nr:VCBS repeat-containing protein [Solirubrobacteraceae bacterium]